MGVGISETKKPCCVPLSYMRGKGEVMNYWIVGATWGKENLAEAFYRRGYWEMGYDDTDQPGYASRRNKIKTGDRIAVKTRDGKAANTICIKAVGIVK